jgi:N utilization substance protein A
LASQGVVTMEDLAELAVPDLQEIVEELEDEVAGKLIMTARAPWFEDAEE